MATILGWMLDKNKPKQSETNKNNFATTTNNANENTITTNATTNTITTNANTNHVTPTPSVVTTLNKPLCLAIIRFIRTTVGTKDDFYVKQIIKSKVFDKILGLLLLTGSKYNLINSSIIELFDFIRKVQQFFYKKKRMFDLL